MRLYEFRSQQLNLHAHPGLSRTHKTQTNKIFFSIVCTDIVNISPKLLHKNNYEVMMFTYSLSCYIYYVVNNKICRGKEACVTCKFDDYRLYILYCVYSSLSSS